MPKNIDLQNKTSEEMDTMLKDLKVKLLQFNFELGEKRLKDFSQVKKTKKQIARILTITKNRDSNRQRVSLKGPSRAIETNSEHGK